MPIPAPVTTLKNLQTINDQCTVKTAFQWVSQGGGLVFQGSYRNARQLLSALGRHIDKRSTNASAPPPGPDAFNQYRQRQSQRTSLLNRFLVEVTPGYQLLLKHAPDIAQACNAAFEPLEQQSLIPLRQILGAISAYEWRKKGVVIEGLSQPLHVHYGVFSPVRGEYLDLVRAAPLPVPHPTTAVDLGTGSGVIAALLVQRGIKHIIATDTNPNALACATENLARFGLSNHVTLQSSDTYPDGQFDLIVCNPPWLPGRPTSALESAVYDPDSHMLRNFLNGLSEHLTPGGEGWLIMSDLAELLGLRPTGAIEEWASAANLRLAEKHCTRPKHPRAADPNDPLFSARSRETTCLWRFKKANPLH